MKSNAARKTRRSKRDKPSLLFVDDEQRVLNSMRALFRRDYNLFLTTRGDDALKIISENNIDVIVADQRMPIMTGVEILSKVKVSSPNTIRILLTGYSNASAIEGAINGGEVYKFLNKPCPVDELRETVREAAEISIVTARKTIENSKKQDQASAKNFSDSMKDVRVKPSLAERLNRIMEAVDKRKKKSSVVDSKPQTTHSPAISVPGSDVPAGNLEAVSEEKSVAKMNVSGAPGLESANAAVYRLANKCVGDYVYTGLAPKCAAKTASHALKAGEDSSEPVELHLDAIAPTVGLGSKPAVPTLSKPVETAVPDELASPVTSEAKDALELDSQALFMSSEVDAVLGADESSVNANKSLATIENHTVFDDEEIEAEDPELLSVIIKSELDKINAQATTQRLTVEDDSVEAQASDPRLETIKLEFDKIGNRVDKDESMLSEFVDKALSPDQTDAVAKLANDHQSGTNANEQNSNESYSQLEGAVHAIPPGLNDRISAKISRSISAKPKPVVPINKIPALGPQASTDSAVDENLFSESVAEKRSFPMLAVPDQVGDKDDESTAGDERFESVEITLGGNTHEIVDLTHSVEIIMSGDNHRIRDVDEEPVVARTDMTIPGGMGGFSSQSGAKQVDEAGATPSDKQLGASASQPLADENRRMRVVGTGKYRISIVVFSSDKAFAKSVGRSLHGFFYTFHATTIEQLTNAIEGVDPAVLITDVSTEPDVIQELIARLKHQVPELVTMVASQHRDADLMVKLINYGQVFRMVDKPMSATACKMYVREALKRHLQLRKNPELMRQHTDRKVEGVSRLPATINRLISGLKLGRARRLFG